MQLTSNSDKITRDYFYSLLIETRYLDAVLPTTEMTLFGECFEKLHDTIVSCHLKDILLKPEYTFQLQECACGEGTLDINLYAQLATAENPHMPMIIEHLTTDEEYVASVQYVRERLAASTSAAVPE